MIDIFVDIDGVINAVSLDPPANKTEWDDDRWIQKRINGYMITWNEELIEHLNELDKLDNVRFVFLTTWQDDAKNILAPELGLNSEDWKVLRADNQSDLFSLRNGWWKHNQIMKELEESGADKFVWLDDDLKFERTAALWSTNLASEGKALNISPQTEYGLTKNDLHAIMEFVK